MSEAKKQENPVDKNESESRNIIQETTRLQNQGIWNETSKRETRKIQENNSSPAE